MSEPLSFTPRPRAAKRQTLCFDVDNFLHELDVITRRIERVAGVPAQTFNADCPEYDSACMVIIRLAGFLEREEYAPYMKTLTLVEKRTLRTARNIAARSGYQSMDDKLLWTAVTRNVPDMIERLRTAVQADR